MSRTLIPRVSRRSALAVRAGILALALVTCAVTAVRAADFGAWHTILRASLYNDVLADSSYVWATTGEAGLLRFDRAGLGCVSITREPGGLASNALTALARDRSRRLWVGTQGAGLSYLSADRTRWNLLNKFDGLPSETVNALTAEGDTLWIGTSAGVALWDGRRVLGTIPSGAGDSPFRSNNITGIVVLSDSVLLATSDGVYLGRYSEGLTRWDDVTGALPTSNVERLVSDGHTAFAFSSDAAWLAPWSLTAGQWVARGGVPGVRTIDADQGSMYIMAGAGVLRWNGAGYDPIAAAPLSGPPQRTWVRPAVAPDGRLYLIKADSLFARHTAGAGWDTVVTVQSVGNNINNLALEGSRLYVNTYSEGIGRLENGAWTRWLTPRTCFAPGCDADTTFFNPSFAFALLVDGRGIKWFSTWGSTDNALQPGAIERLDDSGPTPSFTRYSQPIALGIPWNDAVPNPVRHTFAVAATLDSAGGHWFGMDSPERESPDFSAIGIDYYDAAGNFVRNFGVDASGNNGPRTNRVLALATTKDKWVWVGTNSQGIQKTNPADTLHFGVFRNVEIEQIDVRGLAPAGDTVWAMTTSEVRAYSLQGVPAVRLVKAPIPANPSDDAGHPLEVATDGTIWAGTTSGIQVYRRDGTKLTSYTVANSPIASNDVRAIVCDRARGVMWIGTSGGLNRFDLRYVTPPPPSIPSLDARVYPNPVRLTGLGIDLRLTGNATTYDGAIYDLHGRTMAVISGATNGTPVWNGRDLAGNLVGPGIYFLQLRAGGHTGVERIVLLR